MYVSVSFFSGSTFYSGDSLLSKRRRRRWRRLDGIHSFTASFRH